MTILTINAIRSVAERQRFDQKVVPHLQTVAPTDFSICHLLEDVFPENLEGFSHLLISGSELSAAEQNPRDAELMALIRAFVDSGRPVLGICYGHQMLARALAGDAVCRRSTVPEFGWKQLQSVVANPLFSGLENPRFENRGLENIVPIHSHYDEVYGLDDSFTILASTADCEVQAMQYRRLPVWGVQFHPELSHAEGQRMLDNNLKTEPLAPKLAGNDLESTEQAEQNLLMLESFFHAQATRAAA